MILFMATETGIQSSLKNINFQAKKGNLTCIVGVGGKTALFVMHVSDRSREVKGSATVCSVKLCFKQVPRWIMNGTVKENILFGHRWREFYWKRSRPCVNWSCNFDDGDKHISWLRKWISIRGQKACLFSRGLCKSWHLLTWWSFGSCWWTRCW